LPRMPLDMAPESPAAKEFFRKVDAYVAFARMQKIVEYAKQHGIKPPKLTGAGIALAVSLGIDAGIPGLQTVAADAVTGRPRTRKNEEDSQFLLDIIELIKRAASVETDKTACAIWALCETPELASPHRYEDRDDRAKTLQNLVSTARAAGYRSGFPVLTTARQVEASEQLMARIRNLADTLKLIAFPKSIAV